MLPWYLTYKPLVTNYDDVRNISGVHEQAKMVENLCSKQNQFFLVFDFSFVTSQIWKKNFEGVFFWWTESELKNISVVTPIRPFNSKLEGIMLLLLLKVDSALSFTLSIVEN